MGCATGTIRCVLTVLNVIFMLPALAFVGIGIFVLVSAERLFSIVFSVLGKIKDTTEVQQTLQQLSEQDGLIRAAGFVLVALGVFLLLVTFLGCAGAMKESQCLLATYAVILFLLAAAKIALIIVVFTSEQNLKDAATKGLLDVQNRDFISVLDVENSKSGNKAGVTYLINVFQVALDCCGAAKVGDIANSTSWLASNRTWIDDKQLVVPVTCCPVEEEKKDNLFKSFKWSEISEYLVDDQCPTSGEGINEKTCYDSLRDQIVRSLWLVFGISCSVVFTEILLIIFSLCIACRNKDRKISRDYKYRA